MEARHQPIPQDLARLARRAALEIVGWTVAMMAVSVVWQLATR